jgi:hypothetical protein
MPAPKSRGGARGGGIARGEKHDELVQGSAEEQESRDQFMRDKEHVEKRKRQGP